MATKKPESNSNKNKKLLKREYHMALPDSKAGEVLGRRVRGPKWWRRLMTYFKESRQELKKVTWPSRKEASKLTFAVMIFTTVYSLFTIGVDYIFKEFVQKLFL